MTEIKIIYPDGDKYAFPIYLRYIWQSAVKPAYLYIDIQRKSVWFGFYEEVGNGVDSDIWHYRASRYPVSPLISASDLRKFLQDKNVQELIQEIINNYEIVWDGSNFVGRPLGIDATEAEKELQDLLDKLGAESDYMVLDAEDYFCSEGFNDLVRSGESIYQAAHRLFCEGVDGGVLLECVVDFLKRKKNDIPDRHEQADKI